MKFMKNRRSVVVLGIALSALIVPVGAQNREAFAAAPVPTTGGEVEEALPAVRAQPTVWAPVLAAAVAAVLSEWMGDHEGATREALQPASEGMLLEQAENNGRMLALLEVQSETLNETNRMLGELRATLARIEGRLASLDTR